MDHLVIDRPESVEVKHLLVPAGNGLHLAIGLVTDDVIDVKKLGDRHQSVKRLSLGVVLEAGEEGTGVVHALDEGVDGVTVGLNTSSDDGTVLVGEGLGGFDGSGTALDSLVVDTCGVINMEGDILDTVTVLGVMG